MRYINAFLADVITFISCIEVVINNVVIVFVVVVIVAILITVNDFFYVCGSWRISTHLR